MPTLTTNIGHEFLPGDELVLERVPYLITDVTPTSFTLQRNTWWRRLLLRLRMFFQSPLRKATRKPDVSVL